VQPRVETVTARLVVVVAKKPTEEVLITLWIVTAQLDVALIVVTSITIDTVPKTGEITIHILLSPPFLARPRTSSQDFLRFRKRSLWSSCSDSQPLVGSIASLQVTRPLTRFTSTYGAPLSRVPHGVDSARSHRRHRSLLTLVRSSTFRKSLPCDPKRAICVSLMMHNVVVREAGGRKRSSASRSEARFTIVTHAS